MKKLIFIFCLLFAFPALAAESEVKILPQFLGRWEPYSHGAGNVVLEIMPNGLIYETLNKTGKVLRISVYRALVNRDGRSYIAIHEMADSKPITKFWAFSIEEPNDDDKQYHEQRLEVQYGSCFLDVDDFARKSRSELEKLFNEKRCPANHPLFDGQFAGSDSWVRKVH